MSSNTKTPLTGNFVATGQSASFMLDCNQGRYCLFNASASGTFVGSLQLERSFDNGTTWLPLTAAGTQLYIWTTPASESGAETEAGVLYRFNCTAFTSGTINYRLSQ